VITTERAKALESDKLGNGGKTYIDNTSPGKLYRVGA